MSKNATIFAAAFALILYAITTIAPTYVASVKKAQQQHSLRLAAIEKF